MYNMAAAKEYMLVAVDVSRYMCASGRKAEAISAVQHLLLNKMMYAKKDEVSLLLFGTNDSENSMVEKQPGGEEGTGGDLSSPLPSPPLSSSALSSPLLSSSALSSPPLPSSALSSPPLPYGHIVVAGSFEQPSVAMAKALERIPESRASADLLDVLALSVNEFIGLKKKLGAKYKVGSGRIVLITDFCSPPQSDETSETVEFITNKMRELGVGLDVFAFMQPTDAREDVYLMNRKIITSIVDVMDGRMFAVRDAVALLSKIRTKSVNQVTKFRGDIDIAGKIKIPVYTYAHTAEAKLPTLKKMTARKAEEDFEAAARGDATAGAADEEDEDADNGAVKFERRYFRADTEEKTEVTSEELTKAYTFGKEKFVVDPTEEDTLKLSTDRCLSVLAFVDPVHIPRYILLGTADVVVPAPSNSVASNALSAFARGLVASNRLALARYVKRANAAPMLGALIPALAEDGPPTTYAIRPSPLDIDCLFFVPLPFQEDVRNFEFPVFAADPKTEPSAEQLAATERLIDAMDLMNAPHFDGSRREALQPETTFNPVIARFSSAVLTRALQPTADIPALDPKIARYMHPDERVLAAAEKEIAGFAAALGSALMRPTKPSDVIPAGMKIYSEIQASAGSKRPAGESGAATAAKRVRKGDDGDIAAAALFDPSLASKTRCPVDKVGTVDPVSDFRTMVEWKGQDLVEKACAGMEAAIEALAKSAHAIDKAANCLAEYRKSGITLYEDGRFNTFLRRLKEDHGPLASGRPRGSPFWQRVVSLNLSLINSDEGPTVEDVTPAESASFLKSEVANSQRASTATGPSYNVLDFSELE